MGYSAATTEPILPKVLDEVTFRLSASDGIEVVRQRLRNLLRRTAHPELHVENRAFPTQKTLSASGSIGHHPSCAQHGKLPAPHHAVFPRRRLRHRHNLDTHDGSYRLHVVSADATMVSV